MENPVAEEFTHAERERLASLLPDAPTTSQLVEWAQEQAFREGRAGWHCTFDPSLIEGDLTFPKKQKLERRKTVKNCLQESANWRDLGNAQALYLESHEDARKIVNVEMDKALLSAGFGQSEISQLASDYLEKIAVLDKKKHPRKPRPESFEITVVCEATIDDIESTSHPINTISKMIFVDEPWLDVQHHLRSATDHVNRSGCVALGKGKGHWICHFQTSSEPYPAWNLSGTCIIETETDYRRMVKMLRDTKEFLNVIMYQESVESSFKSLLKKAEQMMKERADSNHGLHREWLEEGGYLVSKQIDWTSIQAGAAGEEKHSTFNAATDPVVLESVERPCDTEISKGSMQSSGVAGSMGPPIRTQISPNPSTPSMRGDSPLPLRSKSRDLRSPSVSCTSPLPIRSRSPSISGDTTLRRSNRTRKTPKKYRDDVT